MIAIIWSVCCARALEAPLKAALSGVCDEYDSKRIVCLLLMDKHTLVQVIRAQKRVRHPRWQPLCEALCRGQWHKTALFSFFYIKPPRQAGQRWKCGPMGRCLSCYCKHMCSAAQLTLFTKQIWSVECGQRALVCVCGGLLKENFDLHPEKEGNICKESDLTDMFE